MGKIIIINHYGNTPDEPGATRHYELADYLAQNSNKNIEYWICGFNHYSGKIHKSFKKSKLFSKRKVNKFDLIRVKSIPYRKSNILRQLNITFFDILTSIKILFSRDVELIILSVPPISIFNALAIKLRKIKLVVDVEDLWPLFIKDMGLDNKIAIKYMDKASKFIYNKADAIDAVSNGMLDYVKDELKKVDKPMWLSPLGINGDIYFNTKTNKHLINERPWKDDFKIMYIGAHNPANDLYSVLDTIHAFNSKMDNNNVSFVFYGDGNQLEDLINYKNNLLLDNVYFEGSVPSNVVNEYLELSDVCLTNLKKIESFKLVRPNKLFQYMALSKPIICGIWGESKDIIENSESGIYVDFTEPAIASDKIINMINDKDKMDKYGKSGKEFILKNGVRENIYREFLSEINEVLDRN